MARTLASLALAALALAQPANALGSDDFMARTQHDIVDLCTAPEDSDLYQASLAFCHGFLVGAYSAHMTEHAGPKAARIVCMPDPAPTRAESIAMYVDWAKAHPEYASESSIESLFKFLTERWPCPSGATGSAKEGAK
jgi:hypothetical protein